MSNDRITIVVDKAKNANEETGIGVFVRADTGQNWPVHSERIWPSRFANLKLWWVLFNLKRKYDTKKVVYVNEKVIK